MLTIVVLRKLSLMIRLNGPARSIAKTLAGLVSETLHGKCNGGGVGNDKRLRPGGLSVWATEDV